MKKENKYYFRIRRFTVIIMLVIISSPKIYSQAQEQGLPTEGKTNLCTPHTNKTVDSPSTSSWANLSAPIDSAFHSAESGALQNLSDSLYTSNKNLVVNDNNYSQAREQGLPTKGKTNLCTPHTNKTVDSPSTSSWANLSAPNNSASHHAELGAHQKFTSVKNEEIYRKVDAVVLIKDNSLSSEFVINPGADMHHIMLSYNRARNVKINNEEELVHDGEFRKFVLAEPVVYQLHDGSNKIIRTKYDIDSDGIVSFDIDKYDKDEPLFIVPSMNDISDFAEYNSKKYNSTMKIELAKIE